MTHTRSSRRRGLTIVEVVVSASLCVVLIGFGARLTSASMNDADQAYVRTSLAIHAADAGDRVARELQLSTLTGEDTKPNRILDAGEDANRNGRLDSDWSLADGGTDQAIVFNRAVDGWLWSGPVTYFVQNGVLTRRENGQDLEICRNVTRFAVSRSGNLVDVSVTLSMRDRKRVVWTESATRRAHVRN